MRYGGGIVVVAVVAAAGYGIYEATKPTPVATPTPTVSPTPTPTPTITPTPAVSAETLYLASSEDFKNIDPGQCRETADYNTIMQVYEGLTIIRGWETRAQPCLATSWEVSEDGICYTWHLRKGVPFHSGDPFNAECVKYSFERLLTMNVANVYKIAPYLDRVEVVDEHTVKTYLKFPWAAWPECVADQVAAVVNPKFVEAHGGIVAGQPNEYMITHEDGTGPYILEEFVPRERIVFKSYPDYWGGWEGKHVRRIVRRNILEVATRLMLLARGDVDVAYVPSGNLPELEKIIESEKLPLVVQRTHEGNPIYSNKQFFIYLNCAKLPFSDINMRLAFQHAFDYDTFVKEVIHGYGIRSGGLIPAGIWGHVDDMPLYDFDLVKAKEYIEKASPEAKQSLAKGLTIYYVPGNALLKEGALMFQGDLAKIGVKMEIREYDYGSWLDMLKAEPDKANQIGETWWWESAGDPYFFTLYARKDYWPPRGWNCTFWGSDEIDGQLDQAAREQNPTVRKEMYRKVEMAWHDGAAWIIIYQQSGLLMMDNIYANWVHGWAFNPCSYNHYYDVWKEPA